MRYSDPKKINANVQYHTKLRSGKVKDLHGRENLSETEKMYHSSFYDVYLKANNAEEDIYLQRVPADPDLPKLYPGQGVTVYYVEWNQKPLIIGFAALGTVEVVDTTPQKPVLGYLWWMVHRARGFVRTTPSKIITDKDKAAKFIEYWNKEIQ
jgi:hypothetical protein